MLLECENLSFHYGRIQALHDVSVCVDEGELVALVGANGAGKTTLLNAISGIEKLSAGLVRFSGDDITNASSHARVRRGIVQVPEGRQMFGPMSVEDNLMLGAYTRPKEEGGETLEHVLELFPMLRDRRREAAGNLSGGQQQMLVMSRALMAKPKILLLDEPSMGLAPKLVDGVFGIIDRLRADGVTIFLVEQNAYLALAIAERAYVLEAGQVVLQGSGQELIDNEKVKQAYLGL
ncbi:MAG: ABC transporter ATP-binding protein [Alphaproteobacteria bacterium]|jgi:branched-chain amino acid transport system ATP-binding protein|nr:ABC transporter ATP-binding protein [Alphaproteobacteria bacterium]MDP6818548.1 ABC transporter ATP-binding protein [Alphaproteobacteria bacterium]|tara:strand:- start:1671 stop:2375 length:705 start_codon:yes stop_codon:yes gene_type:complete